MTLTPGSILGPFEILAPLGAGGMGEVVRARDTRLGRDVAIKSLPDAFAQDPERLARFEREARLLASLSHPNVAGIHGLELLEGHRYLVLEFVEGESLAQRLARSPLAVRDAIDIGRQIAAGVEAAHDAGVVHRDLKPGNVMLKPDGTVKVLDFGLAKAGAGESKSGSDLSLSASPTMTYAMTGAGVILGTAAYMSPEQARGRSVDRRSDIWSFGCVLYECLTGKRIFDGETVSDMVARILEREPDWSALPAATPAYVRALLQRCLAKDAKQRLQAIGEARILLEQAVTANEPQAPAARAGSMWQPALAWVLAAVFAALWLVARGSGQSSAQGERRVELGFPSRQHEDRSVPQISPDGQHIVIAARDSAGTFHLWVRDLDHFEFRSLKGTEGGNQPFWSPNSREVGYLHGSAVYRVSIADGTSQKVVDLPGAGRGLSWGKDGTILYTPSTNAGIWRVPVAGGVPTPATVLDTTLIDGSHRFPQWLPDGKHFLYALWSNNPRELADKGGIYLGSVDGKASRRICPDVGGFCVDRRGDLFVSRNGALVALSLDLRSLQVRGDAVPVADPVALDISSGFLRASCSDAGDIVFAAGSDLPPTELVWCDRNGRREDPLGITGLIGGARLSPEGTRAVCEVRDATGLDQLWLADLTRHTLSRLSHDANDSFGAAWRPDGQSIAFINTDTGHSDLYLMPANGTSPKRRLLGDQGLEMNELSWSPDGQSLFFSGDSRVSMRNTVIGVFDARTDSARVVLQGEFSQSMPALSPDGHWLAYRSNESGDNEVYIRSYPDLQQKWQVSTSGGGAPHWRSDGRELWFGSGAGSEASLFAVTITPSGSGLAIGAPQRVQAVAQDVGDISPAPDHSRMLEVIQPASATAPVLRYISGWNAKAPR